MRKVYFAWSFIFCLGVSLVAQSIPLAHSLTSEEKEWIAKQYAQPGESWEQTWARYLQSKKQQFAPEQLPDVLSAPAEFERADGVCFAWRGYTSLLKQLIREVSEGAKAYVAVSSNAWGVSEELRRYGCNMNNVEIMTIGLNSVWMRDYGPVFIYTPNGDREIVDVVYNRPRPEDDRFPSRLAAKYGWQSHLCNLVLAGGNLVLDGQGVAIMTDVVFDAKQGGDPNLTMAQLQAYMRDYFGCHTVYVLEDMQADGTGHVDMFCKLLDNRNIIVGSYASPGDAAGDNYAILNRNAQRLANMQNGVGENFIVTRMPMPRYNGNSYTHTNSLIINEKVLVPTYNRGTDREALDIYQKLMPNHEIIGFDCNQIISANGAIHCITKLVMSDPLAVEQTSFVASGDTAAIQVRVDSASPLSAFAVRVHWKTTSDAEFTITPLETFDGENYFASLKIPPSAEQILYFIRVEDTRGMFETSPQQAPEELHTSSLR